MLQSLATLILILLLAFGLVSGLAYHYQDQMLFHPQPLTPDSRDRFAQWAVSADVNHTRLQGWYVPHADPQAPLLVYYGGNAEEVSWNLPALRSLDVSVLLFNYRGYGDSAGFPSEAALKADALVLLDKWLADTETPPTEVILMGRSLGSGVATYVASQRPVGGVILVTPYDSLVAVAQHHYPWLPVKLLMRNRFESIKLAPHLRMPLLSLLAEQDRVVPAERGRQLNRAWQGPVQELTIPDTDHGSLSGSMRYYEAIKEFVGALKTVESP